MKHTSKRLLSILLCLVLMLSLVPAAYADGVSNVSKEDLKKLADACEALYYQIAASANPDTQTMGILAKVWNTLNYTYKYFNLLGQSGIDNNYNLCLYNFVEKCGGSLDEPVIGINLYPVVLQANSLYNRYGEFYGKSVISGLVNGFSAAFPKLVGNVDWSDFKTAWDNLEKETDNPFPVLSGLNPSIAKVWNTIGQNFVGTENSTAGDGSVVGAIAALEAGITLPAAPVFPG